VSRAILGIHHITAIAGEPQQTLDFYGGFLGLRLVKLTVNFDDAATYHLYYGDQVGHPGTILTFFPWPGAPKGRRGNGQVTVVSFSIPRGAIDYWAQRLRAHGMAFDGPFERFDEQVLSLEDPAGICIEFISGAQVSEQWAHPAGGVPLEYAIQGFHSATLSEGGYQQTAALLTDVFRLKLRRQAGNRFRYGTGSHAE